ncbi:MAG TPA: sigma-70 family RNA polymerase sigma factor [Candidatus Saccharimonadales bacterium]
MPEQFSHSSSFEKHEGFQNRSSDSENEMPETEEDPPEVQHEAAHHNVAERRAVMTDIIKIYNDHPEVIKKVNEARKNPRPLNLIDTSRAYDQLIKQFPFTKDKEATNNRFQKIEAGFLAWQSSENSQQQEAALVEMVAAQRILLFSNLALVSTLAARNIAGSMTWEDLMHEGIEGLNKTIAGFDHSKGHEFSTYAVPIISGAIKRAVANYSRMIRLPANAHDSWRSLVNSNLITKLGHDPTDKELEQELASTMGRGVGVIRAYLQASDYHLASLDAPLDSEGNTETVGNMVQNEIIEGDRVSDQAIALASIERVLRSNNLKAEEKLVLALIFGVYHVPELSVEKAGEPIDTKHLVEQATLRGGLPPKEVAKIIGKSPQGFRNIRDRALEKARAILEEDPEASSANSADIPYYKRRRPSS